MRFYTYLHRRNDTGQVFYIGRGVKNRYLETSSRNPHWHNVANKHGWTAAILARWETSDEANEHEKFLIACFRDMGHPLVNMTNGGEGTSGCRPSAESIKKRADARRGVRQSEACVRKRVEKLEAKIVGPDGSVRSQSGWARHLGMSRTAVLERLSSGRFPDGSLRSDLSLRAPKRGPLLPGGCVGPSGEFKTQAEWAKDFGVSQATVSRRLSAGRYPDGSSRSAAQ